VSAGTAAGAGPVSSLWDELGIGVRARRDVLGIGVDGLVGLALRRNPLRSHLLVSRVLGKHLPVDPARALACGRLLAGEIGAVAGMPDAALVIGYCETATSLGHAVADCLPGSYYLHTTRRRVPGRAPTLEFTESHSHAAFHWLMPADPGAVTEARPVVLVDDELSTGRTALGTIRALHAYAPHPSYVVATLFDARPASARSGFDELAGELGVPIVVVSLLTGEVTVPADIAERAARIRARTGAAPAGASLAARRHKLRRIVADWPAGLPDGARHGWAPAHSDRLSPALAPVAREIAAGLTKGGRTLVLGTEEFMYVPLRIADALVGTAAGDVRFQSTTRSPVHVVDVEGYAIRSGLSFPSPDEPARISHVYNVRPGMYDDIVVVLDDGAQAARGPGGGPRPAGGAALAGLLGGLRGCGAVTLVTIPSFVPAERTGTGI
jgi:adenine/guanine phosphoribosyltransferase-like PRPP-binding protein